MRNKRTRLLILLLTIMVVVAMIAMIACEKKPSEDRDDPVPPPDKKMTFVQYMEKLNAGIKNGQANLAALKDYHVKSEYTLMTREENLTLTYEAVYKTNKRDGNYYIKLFDNENGIDRLTMYYDAADLYVTAGERHYVINNFSTLLLFETFASAIDVLDMGNYAYGTEMQEIFSPNTVLTAIMGVKNMSYAKVGEKGERITASGINLEVTMGRFNDRFAALNAMIGTTFDAITDNYLGFRLSKMLIFKLKSCSVKEASFNLTNGDVHSELIDIRGTIDESKYMIKGEYAHDVVVDEIAAAKGLPDAYVYEKVSPGKGSLKGKTTIPELRESDFDFALDYDVVPSDNKKNKVTMRVYDDLSVSSGNVGVKKYDDINEIISVYYKDALTYINTKGAYDFIGTTVALGALRLPKVYLKNFDLSGFLAVVYADLLRAADKMTIGGKINLGSKAFESIINAVESNVEKKEIKVTVTEDLVRELRGEDKSLLTIMSEQTGIDEELLRQYLGDDFFRNMRVVITYNFGTKIVKVDVYDGTKLVISTDLHTVENVGVIFPDDLNELNYTEFREPELVTVEYEIELNPYGARNVSLSEFVGSFIGDATGKNTPYIISEGHYVVAKGKMSERYVVGADGKKKAVTSLDMEFFLEDKGKKTTTKFMSIVSDSDDLSKVFIELYTPVGDSKNERGIAYVMSKSEVARSLETLSENSIFAGKTGLSAFLAIYNAAEKNAKTYTTDGFFCVDLMVTEKKDPVNELVGIKNTNARVKCKIGFDPLDLSGVEKEKYTTPVVHAPDDASATSIYSNGSKWKETVAVTVSDKRINMRVTYDPESIKIVTGKTEYNPVSKLFGKEFGYALQIVGTTGTYRVKNVIIDREIIDADKNRTPFLVIDPAFYSGVPKTIRVMFEGGEYGSLDCEIEGLEDANVTHDGYNLALFAEKTDGIKKYKLVIGKDSIASIEKEIYVGVVNRTVKPVTDNNGNELRLVNGEEQIPVVAQFVADPYTHAMMKRIRKNEEGKEYDYLAENIVLQNVMLDFESLYGYESYDDGDGIKKRPLYYNREGYNYMFLTELGLEWEFINANELTDDYFYYGGETRYAVATYGDEKNGSGVKIAIKITVNQMEVKSVIIDNKENTYVMDVLKTETYDIPTVTSTEHTVKIKFNDDRETTRIVSLSRPAGISTERYCTEYVYGSLEWAGREKAKNRLNLNGVIGLFGEEGSQTTNTTTATFGKELGMSVQTVRLSVLAPRRTPDRVDEMDCTLVKSMSASGEPAIPMPANLNMVKFTEPEGKDKITEIDYFSINPYNKTARLPDRIWLYLPAGYDSGEKSPKEWVEYPVRWLTTDVSGKELNIIKKNDDGNFVLAHPRTDETKLIVYGVVGNSEDSKRQIIISTALLNMESNVKEYVLYLKNGGAQDKDEAVSIDPYLSYEDVLPSRFEAKLGSGETVSGETEWYYGEFPVYRNSEYGADYKDARYDKYYGKDGYYLFDRRGGQAELKMTVASGAVKNDIYVMVNVASRTIKSERDGDVKISDYIDIFATGKEDGEVYNGATTAGYPEISYYTQYSAALHARIARLIEDGGVGVAGFSFIQIDDPKVLYAKEVRWDLGKLREIERGLTKKIKTTSFALTGTINSDTINETAISVLVSIDEVTSTVTEIELVSGETMTSKGVYEIKNDEDNNGKITVVDGGEGKQLTNAAYYRADMYDAYFGPDKKFEYNTFENVLFFDVSEAFRLSRESSGVYAAPSDYFEYLFRAVRLKFTSGKTIVANASASINYGGKDAAYFNKNVLGFGDVYYETGRTLGYGFVILERFSEGSALDRTLVIVAADKSTVDDKQREDYIDALGEDLNELYPERYNLPEKVTVGFRKEDGSTYNSTYAVKEWTPYRDYFSDDRAAKTSIPAEYINIIDGVDYTFSYVLPDMEGANATYNTFYYNVKFRKKNVRSIFFDGSGQTSTYDIKEGKINVDNTYTFLSYDPAATDEKRYVVNLSAIPTVVKMIADVQNYQAGGSDIYTVKWNFLDEEGNSRTAFDEKIFRQGTDENGVLIATYSFDSYYDSSRKKVTQTLELRLVLAPMRFYAIADENFTVIAHQNEGEDELLNTIVIDPYNNTMGNNGTLTLPSTLTLSFNAGQKFKFSNVSYGLLNAQGTYQKDIRTIGYNENGHKLDLAYTPDPTWLNLRVYVRGYSEEMGKNNGIRINIKFLKRNITDTRIPNSVYLSDGSFDYERDANGNIIYNENRPLKKTYNSYAKYAFSGSGFNEEGRMPVYFVDPYNSATFALPTKALFEFASTEAGVYVEYGISGWQYYNYSKSAYEDFEEFKEGKKPSSFTRFYTAVDDNNTNKRSYFNPSTDSYKGQTYALRGYVSVGDERQYFDVVMVVLNRSLRTSAILKDEYKVNYDFIDPIAAMLKDIPQLFGENAFVDYDRYTAKFSAGGRRTYGEGTYDFVLEEGGEFSRKDENGVATNHAIVPEMLWSSEYDTDGDGIPDTLFEQLVNKGFVGTIDGNLYSHDTGIKALFKYYELKKDAEYGRLASALLWDELFLANGSISSAYSDAARRAIQNEAAELEKEVIFATYKIVVAKTGTSDEIAAGSALSEDDKYALTTTVIDAILQIINKEDQKLYDKNKEEDMKYLAYRTYLATKDSYDRWTETNGDKDIRVRIYEAWTACIKEYRAADVKNSGNISANQKAKAEHFLKIYNKEGAFNTAEKAALDAKKKTIMASLYVNRNSALWDEVYFAANPVEREMMSRYEKEYQTTDDDGRSGKSMASDFFRRDVSSLSDIGTKGERAEADVSIPVIKYSSIEVTGGGTTIRFNKFNFQSIDKTFTVRFELSYDEIYKRMLEEAEEAVRSSYREEMKSEVLGEYEIQAIKDRVNAIAPKKTDKDGNYYIIDGLKNKGGKAFDYDMWIKGNDKDEYRDFWNALIKHYRDAAISIIVRNVSVLTNKGYDDIKEDATFGVSVPEWKAITDAFKEVSILSIADGKIADVRGKFDFEKQADRRQAVRYLATFVADGLKITIGDAYVKLGLNAIYATDHEYEVTEEIWTTVKAKFRFEAFREIALNKLAYIEKNNDVEEEKGRNKAVRDLAEYLVESDVSVSKLEEVYENTEKEKRATTLANTLLVTTSADEGMKKAARAAASEVGSDEPEVGYAVLFSYSYPATVTDVMYDLLEATFGQSNEAFTDLCDRHSTKRKKKAIVAYLSKQSENSELRIAAETYFTFLTRYAKGKISPYDVMMKNPTGVGYAATSIETIENGLPTVNCLLYYAEPNQTYLDAIKSKGSAIGMTEREITVAMKRMKLYDTLYSRASQQDKDNYYSVFEKESSYVAGNDATERLFSALEKNGEQGKEITAALVSFYDKENQKQNNLAYFAFCALVNKAIEVGTTDGKAYETFVDEYVAENEHKKSKELLDAIQANYDESKKQSDSSVTGIGYISKNYYSGYFEGKGYLTINDYTDDYHDVPYLKEELDKILEKKGLAYGETAKNAIAETYMKDTLLRSIAKYCASADATSRATIEEVVATFTGRRINGGDAETEFIALAATNNLGAELGIKIYDALNERDDFDRGEVEKIKERYYAEWLEEARGAAKKNIQSTQTSQIEKNAAFNAEISRLTGLMNVLSGKAEGTPLEGGTLDSAKEVATVKIRAQMLATAENNCIKYNAAYNATVKNALYSAAKTYAYDRMCEVKSESGNYVYRAALEEIMATKTKEAAEGSGKQEFDERKFDEAEQSMLRDKMSAAKNAINLAIKTALYAKTYDKITLFSLTANEFAYKLYAFINNGATSDNAAAELFGTNLNGADGMIGNTLNEYAAGQAVDPTGEARRIVNRLADWWKAGTAAASIYGVLGEEERAFIEQIYRQAYYQANALAGGALTSALSAEVAYATMTTSIYLFLQDKDDEESKVPADYYSAGNEDEYKAFIVGLMLDGDLLNQKGHALTLAAARLNTVVTELALNDAKLLCEYTGTGTVVGSTTLSQLVDVMANVLIKASGVIKTGEITEEEIAEREKFYLGYLEKAVNYVEYTSVYGAEEYSHSDDLLASNPLHNYADKIYVKVTGKNLYGISRTDLEREDEFGMLSFGKYLEKANGDYSLALELMTETRIVEVRDFVSEDHAEKGYVHVVYFDRLKWNEDNPTGSEGNNPYYDNCNVFIANDGKTYRIVDVSGGYGYANALKATGLKYTLSDFTEIDLYFDADESNPYNEPTRVDDKGDTVIDYTDMTKYAKAMETNEKKNLLMLDALAPELPDKAYAIGYVKTGAAIDYAAGIKLGKVDITEYSQEFNKLVYKGIEAETDDAYVIKVREARGTVYQKQGDIRVGYLDRNVQKVYLETGAYIKGRAKPETSGEFVNMYSQYDETTGNATSGKNVIYIDPTNVNLVLSEKKSYAMPTAMTVKCGEGEKIEFTDVVWDMSKVKFGLSGTDNKGIDMRVLEYRYVDGNGNTRKIEYDYAKFSVTMTTYDKDTGEEKRKDKYELSKDDMIDWNTVLVIENQSLQGISDSDTNNTIAEATSSSSADATSHSLEINPYYPEYPEKLQLTLANGSKNIELTQSDWAPDLTKLNNIRRGVATDYKFDASFYYLGYEIKVKFKAMEITVPIGEMLDGGTIYLMRDGGDYGTQFKRNYGEMYFNFAKEEEGKPNWQKVPVALKDANKISKTETGIQQVKAVIGSTSVTAGIEANVKFNLRLIDLKNYAEYDGGYNNFVYYDYYSIPSDGSKKATGTGESPAAMGDTFLFVDSDGEKAAFNAESDALQYDFIGSTVTVYATYGIDKEADAKLAYDANGTRKRGLYFTMPMESYERSDVSDVEFVTDATGKKWKWTSKSKTSPDYVDAIYWKIGTPMKASDLPTIRDRITGKEIKLDWDLAGLNVNRANVEVPNHATTNDGAEILGYYMIKNGIWQSVRLRVYIEKINITDHIIGFTKADGTKNEGTTLEKEYNAQYYELPFNAEADDMAFLREDGTHAVIPAENYVVEYMKEGTDVWSSEQLPLDAGTYYIRVRLRADDYNVYIEYDNDKLFTLTIKPYVVDMSKVKFVGEDANGAINVVYGASNVFTVAEGLPAFTPAGWFTPGEKSRLYNNYVKDGMTEEEAKAEVYGVIYNRVADRTKDALDAWYREGKATFGYDRVGREQDIKIKAWIYDSKMDAGITLVEIQVRFTYYYGTEQLDYVPTDCGNYTVKVNLDKDNANYVEGEKSKNVTLRIERDENIRYAFATANLVYNGRVQNPEISDLHKDGTVPFGVKVTYRYVINGKLLVVLVEGVKDVSGNVVNKITVDSANTTVTNPTSGIKNAGAYICSVEIDGGNNYPDGKINDQPIGISAAKVFIDIADINKKYLSDVANLSEYVKVYDEDGNEQEEGILLGGDKLADLGILRLSAADAEGITFGSYFKVGTYYTFIDGLASSSTAATTYTELDSAQYGFNGYIYSKLALKSYDKEGSLYKDADGNAAVIDLFGNYNIFVRTHEFVDGVKAAGIYKVEGEDGSDGVASNAELQEYIANLKDGDYKIVYLSSLIDAEGNVAAYDPIVIDKAVRLKIVGYTKNGGISESGIDVRQIETKIKGIRVLKGIVELRIISIESDASGNSALFIGDEASAVSMYNCRITKSGNKTDNVTGVETSVNYKGSVYVEKTTIDNVSMAINFVGGALEVRESTIERNYNGIVISTSGNNVNIAETKFGNNIGTAITSVTGDLTIRKCRFEYNGISLDLPVGTPIRTDINNANVYENNGDDSLYE